MSDFRNADGTFASGDPDQTIPMALAKDRLRRILTTPCNGRGQILDARGEPYTFEDQQWAAKVMRECPDWARDTLRNAGVL